MLIDKLYFKNEKWIVDESEQNSVLDVQIIFVFGHIDILKDYNHSFILKEIYPNAHVVGVSTAGNILDSSVDIYEAVASAISFEKGYIQVASEEISLDTLSQDSSNLIDSLDKNNLKHILLLLPGLINASEILKEIKLDKNITISGGLAGDSYKFESTCLFLDEDKADNLILGIGFYGKSIHVRIGCETGWREFGAKRVVTKSFQNIVYEIDNKPAIELYEKYLGHKINALPNSALRFPLSVKKGIKNKIIRVIMKINEDKSLVYAGNIEEGSVVRLMRTNINNILDGAFLSVKRIRPYNDKRSLGLTISCSARRKVLKQFSDEEIEIVQSILTTSTQIIGFYSYGEIAPFSDDLTQVFLHNQTMTITTIYED